MMLASTTVQIYSGPVRPPLAWHSVARFYVFTALLLVAGVAGTAWAVTDLRDGLTEAPRHWWSSLPLMLVAAAVILGVTGWAVARRSRRTATLS